jgi:hypothetical protein
MVTLYHRTTEGAQGTLLRMGFATVKVITGRKTCTLAFGSPTARSTRMKAPSATRCFVLNLTSPTMRLRNLSGSRTASLTANGPFLHA